MKKYQAVIVGAGFSGMCMGIKLKAAGLNDFVIIEKAHDVGGTWRENTYPGAECDIPSALYSYSFEHNDEWEYKWSGQAQILKYQQDTAVKYGLTEHLVLGCEINKAVFDEATAEWTLSAASGQQFQAQHFICAVGQLHIPAIPPFSNLQEFEGDHFHSAEWDHAVELAGKRVAVIGNAASAVQIVPAIVDKVEQLTVFQRSPNWMLPKVDRPYTSWEQRLSRKIPLLARFYRFSIWIFGEWLILPALRGNRLANWVVGVLCRRNLSKAIKDPELRRVLTPDYPLGAKRILFGDTYYPALLRDNVALQTEPVESFTPEGIRVAGQEIPFDVVVFATGFQTNPFLASIEVRGSGGQLLSEHWRDGAYAYLGIATHGFPNLYMMYGPNTNLGHSSILLMIEAQADYIVQCMQALKGQALVSIEVKAGAEQSYNEQLQQRLSDMAFNQIDKSWYKDGDRITNNWAGGTLEYARLLREVDWTSFDTR